MEVNTKNMAKRVCGWLWDLENELSFLISFGKILHSLNYMHVLVWYK